MAKKKNVGQAGHLTASEHIRSLNISLVRETLDNHEQINELRSELDIIAADVELRLTCAAAELRQTDADLAIVQDKLGREMEEMKCQIERKIKQLSAENKSNASKISALANECGYLKNKCRALEKEFCDLKSYLDEQQTNSELEERRVFWKVLIPSASIIFVVAALAYAARAR